MTLMEQVHQLAELGVDYAGFIFYEKSPRFAGRKIKAEELKEVKNLQKVGVFVNETEDNILARVEQFGLNAVQLHGDETPALCNSLRKRVEVIKAFRIGGEEDPRVLTVDYKGQVNYFLFDTMAAAYGGTGKKFDWSVLDRVSLSEPYFLSGGIGLTDVEQVKLFTERNDVFALDVNSRFETAPGVKDMNKITEFSRLINE